MNVAGHSNARSHYFERLRGVCSKISRSRDVAHAVTEAELARVLGCYPLGELKAA